MLGFEYTDERIIVDICVDCGGDFFPTEDALRCDDCRWYEEDDAVECRYCDTVTDSEDLAIYGMCETCYELEADDPAGLRYRV